uniref:Uncharacterized protein n=1 Tax=Desertifilum tharense IPPAS B-1220 TaxID=1781255 RepID=A0ACD5GWF1_9CYAN
MLVYNNQVFTDRDFESIRHLGQSEKAQDLQKTGRFGIGFNAIYHVTDFPSFISRHRLIFFDPHGAAIPGTSRQQPGTRVALWKRWMVRKLSRIYATVSSGWLNPRSGRFSGNPISPPFANHRTSRTQ